MTEMAFEATLDMPFAESVAEVIGALQKEGFGVLTRIDVHDALKQKLGIDFRQYTILGACNPPLAHQALSHRPEIGLMLPCNVVVENSGEGRTLVRIANPEMMLQAGELAGDPALEEVARAAEERLRRVAKALRD